jgi:hypothetical protein
VGLAALTVAAGLAQSPDLSGTWALDAGRSRVAGAAAMSGLVATGAPARLHVTHAANGTVLVESEINEGHARLYAPGRTTTTAVSVGLVGTVTMTARWEGRALVAEGRTDAAPGGAGTARRIRETFSLDPDGRTLRVGIEVTTPEGSVTSALVYTRSSSVGPCESWPTPCKRPAG